MLLLALVLVKLSAFTAIGANATVSPLLNATTTSAAPNVTVPSPSDNVTFFVSPPEIVKGLTTELNLQCSFRRDNNPSLTSVLSILISHSNDSGQPAFIYVATVNEIEAQPHNVSSDVTKMAGSVDNSGESFLRVTVRLPNTDSGALYKCEVNGFDSMGKPVTLTNTTRIPLAQSGTSSLYNEIRAMKALLDSQQAVIDSIQDRLSYLNCSAPSTQNSNITNPVESTQNNTITARLEAMLKSMFYSSNAYNGHRYYLAKAIDHFIYSEAQATCEMHGGYLVEIDDHYEFNFIVEFILKHNHYQYIWTGATDAAQEGVWVNPHGGTTSPTFDWGTGFPKFNDIMNCQCCHYFTVSWQLSDCLCNHRSTNIGDNSYICEISE